MTKSLALVGAAAMLLATGCSDTGESETITGSVVQDFSLSDENATSATFGQQVSPRDYLGQGSAWYFGHST